MSRLPAVVVVALLSVALLVSPASAQFRQEQGPVQELQLEDDRNRAFRHLLLRRRGRERLPRGPDGGAGVRAPFHHPGARDPAPRPGHRLRVPHRLPADEHLSRTDPGGGRRDHGVLQAPGLPALHGILRRVRPRPHPRDGPRLPGRHHVRRRRRGQPLQLPGAALVHGGNGGVPVDRRRRSEHRDVAPVVRPRGSARSAPVHGPRLRHPELPDRPGHLRVRRGELRGREDRRAAQEDGVLPVRGHRLRQGPGIEPRRR